MSKPIRPGLKFNNLDELLADVDQLRAGPYEQGGQWDLPMMMDHLAKQMNGPFETKLKNWPWPAGPIVRFFFHRLAKWGKYPSVKFPAPKMTQPSSSISSDDAYAELSQVVGRLKSATGETIACPPFGELPLADFMKVQLLHAAHHLSFLKSL